MLDFLVLHWHAILVGGVGTMFISWLARLIDTKGKVWVHDELEKLRDKINTNPLMAQVAADDYLITVIEETIPVILDDFDDTVHQTLAQGNLGAMNWVDFGKRIWATCKEHVEGGANDYLKNSSFKDGEILAAYIAERFFITQKMSAKGLIVDNARGTVADVTTTTTQTVKATRGETPGKVVSEEVHTEVKPS